MKQAKVPPAAALTFTQNVMYRDDVGNKSVFLEAGQPSPWVRLEDVPARLQGLIGAPSTDPPRSAPNQYWMSSQQLASEREMLDALNTNSDMDPSLQADLASRDEEYVQLSQSRAKVLTEIAERDAKGIDRVAREMEQEAAERLKEHQYE